ncbi:SDR family NAD(P)-dependent oxidoreductase [Pedobacter frigiditerrae]|uniref:SDR family NAD(P)-dependent oxidoreductase n=1 Tax=Pedobacter frigiditerrae TaxID=2530452 RepID=A0A4R0MMQ0_9SPHI|nr:SDR family NAD(P)-dependent oxidoreductase [Pedobacter frigiditerrae]TCC87995.1 SDR family NAD(P)-dependent oxidoreductase [Pedobacter frigiditerrae]
MKTTKNTILITGGSAGIGFETAKLLSEQGNNVIIIGRDQNRLDEAKAKLNNVTAIKADVSKAEDVKELVATIARLYPELNVVINNAGRALLYNLADESQNAYSNAEDEMLTNYLSIIRLNQQLLPLLKHQKEAAIVNVSSIVAYVPGITLPTYAASKAAVHSYTTSLRLSLENTSVKVFELFPPLVNTEFSAAIGGHNGIEPLQVAEELLEGLKNDEFEIRVGDTAKIYDLFRSSPVDALNVMNANRAAWIESIQP